MRQQSETNLPVETSIKHIALLATGDLLALLLFVWIGRRSHALSITDMTAVLSTALPFIMGWFLVAPWFGLFRADVSQSWRKLIARLLIAWVVLGGPLSLILRTIFLGRPLFTGLIPTFALITMIVTTLFLMIWRLGYVWWCNRNSKYNEVIEGT